MVRHNGGSAPAPATVRSAPNVTAEPKSKSVVLKFSPANETAYHIYSDFGDDYKISLKDLQANTYTINNLLANTKYTYLISSTIETNEPLHYNSQMKVLVFKTLASGGKRKRKTKRRKTLRIITRKRL